MENPDSNIKNCPYCGHKSSIKEFGSWEKDGKRGLLGKTVEGFIMFLCPQCENHIKYDPLADIFVGDEETTPNTCHVNQDILHEARGKLHSIAATYFLVWLITLLIYIFGTPFEKIWTKAAVSALLGILLIRSSIPNIRLINIIHSFFGGSTSSIRNNLILAYIGLAGSVYSIVSVWAHLPISTAGIALGTVASLFNGMQGKKL